MNKVIGFYTNEGILIQDDSKYDYAQIELLGGHARDTDRGNQMLVSFQDVPVVMNFKWYLNKNGYPSTYGSFCGTYRFSRPVAIHRLLTANTVPEGMVVDHINRNRLDNRRENFRICTPAQNSYNRTITEGKQFKGVTKISKNNYMASVTKDGVRREIKNIPSEEEAAKIYDMMALELFGEYASLNFPQ
jgi:hypothetical protein